MSSNKPASSKDAKKLWNEIFIDGVNKPPASQAVKRKEDLTQKFIDGINKPPKSSKKQVDKEGGLVLRHLSLIL